MRRWPPRFARCEINDVLRDHLDEAHWINLGLADGEVDNLSIVNFGELSR